MDSQGGMWLGTYFGGLNYYHPIRNRFKNIQRIPYKNSLSDNVVSCITEDKDKNLWIGTNDGGLNLYNTKTQQFTHYILQEDEREIGIGSNNIKAVYVDEQKSLVYIGTLNPQLHSRSATYKRNGLLIRKTAIKSSRPFQCAYYPLTP